MAMSENLLSLVQQFMTPEFIKKGSSVLGQSPEKMQTGLRSVVPTFLMGLINQGSTPNGAQTLMNRIKKDDYESGVPSNYMDHLQGGESTDRYLQKGNDAVSGVFGNQASPVMDKLSGSTGIHPSILGKMMAFAAPLVMGVLGSKVKREGLDASSLSGFLGRQKASIAGFLPAGVLETPISAKRPEVLDRVSEAPERPSKEQEGERLGEYTSRHEKQHRSNWMPLALVALLAVGGFWYIKNQRQVNEVAQSTTTTMKEQAGQIASKTKEEVQGIAPESNDQAGKAAPKAQAPAGPAPARDSMSAFLDKGPDSELPKRFSFNNLTFESGTSKLTAKSEPILDRIASDLKAHPTAQANLQGFADSVGSSEVNKTLSIERAKAVKQALIDRGVSADHLNSIGMGTSQSMASNDTEQAREWSRRTDIIIVRR
jgi:outer membrane protein OmpA-like peptidoglycan-associated protein